MNFRINISKPHAHRKQLFAYLFLSQTNLNIYINNRLSIIKFHLPICTEFSHLRWVWWHTLSQTCKCQSPKCQTASGHRLQMIKTIPSFSSSRPVPWITLPCHIEPYLRLIIKSSQISTLMPSFTAVPLKYNSISFFISSLCMSLSLVQKLKNLFSHHLHPPFPPPSCKWVKILLRPQ